MKQIILLFKMKQIFIFCILSIIVISCTNEKSSLLENQYGDPISLEKTSMAIHIDENTLCSYQTHSILKTNKNELLFAYNSPMHSIGIFNLADKAVSHIQLETEGTNGILKNVTGIYVHKEDYIWLYSQGFLYLIDSCGIVNKKIELPFPTGGFSWVETNFSMSTSKLFYHPTRESIFYLTVTPTEKGADYLVYEYFIQTDSFKTYPLKGGVLEEKAGRNFGWMQFPNVTYTLDDILYNFPINSNIYQINIETGKESSFGGQSKYTYNMASELCMPYTFQDADKHLIENIHFFEIQYDPKKEIYYRLHLDKANYSTDIKSNLLYNSKNLYLTIFNKNFEIIYENKLDSKIYCYLNSWGILNNKFFITKDNLLNEDKDFDSFELDLFEPIF